MTRALAIVIMLLGIAASALVIAGRPAEGGSGSAESVRTVSQRVGPSACEITGTKTAGPSPVLLGETVHVTMTTSVSCDDPLRIVLVVDASGSMQGDRSAALKEAATRFVDVLDPDGPADIEIGVVQFNTEAKTLCELTDDRGRLVSCIGHIGPAGGTNVGAGIRQGLRVLEHDTTETARRIMILVTDTVTEVSQCHSWLQAARSAKDQGILLIGVCVGPDCDAQCTLQMATSPAYFYHAAAPSALLPLFETLATRVTSAAVVSEVAIVDPLGPNVTVIPNSPQPPADPDRSTDRRLVWHFENPPANQLTATLSVTPTRPGLVETNAGATVFITDHAGLTATLLLSDPQILVLRPDSPTPGATVSATASATVSATATITTPTSTDTPEATATVTSTPDVEGSAIFLPVALNDAHLSPHGR